MVVVVAVAMAMVVTVMVVVVVVTVVVVQMGPATARVLLFVGLIVAVLVAWSACMAPIMW